LRATSTSATARPAIRDRPGQLASRDRKASQDRPEIRGQLVTKDRKATRGRPATTDPLVTWVKQVREDLTVWLVLQGQPVLTASPGLMARLVRPVPPVPLATRVQWATRDLQETLARPDSRERLALRARQATKDRPAIRA
jgi:hypothetical protein